MEYQLFRLGSAESLLEVLLLVAGGLIGAAVLTGHVVRRVVLGAAGLGLVVVSIVLAVLVSYPWPALVALGSGLVMAATGSRRARSSWWPSRPWSRQAPDSLRRARGL